MPEKIGTLDLNSLKDKSKLSESDVEAIAAAGIAEADAELNKGKEGIDPPPAEDPAKKKEEEKAAAAEAEQKKADDDKLINTPDDQLDDDGKARKAELVKARAEAAKPKEETAEEKAAREAKEKEDLDKEVKSYAQENSISEDEARTELEGIKGVMDKYKADPKALAKATLHIQRLYTKTQEDLKAAKEKAAPSVKEITEEMVIKAIDDGKLTAKDKDGKDVKVSRENIIAAYREDNPDLTDDLPDESVLKLAAKDIKSSWEKEMAVHSERIVKEAADKKTKLLNDLSEADKQFIPEIKPLLDRFSPMKIVDKDFSLADLVLWAKGKKYEADTKAAEEKGYKRGLEEGKILGTKAPPGGKQPAKKASRTLTDADKKRALEMYSSLAIPDEEKYQYYIEYLEDEEKSKK